MCEFTGKEQTLPCVMRLPLVGYASLIDAKLVENLPRYIRRRSDGINRAAGKDQPGLRMPPRQFCSRHHVALSEMLDRDPARRRDVRLLGRAEHQNAIHVIRALLPRETILQRAGQPLVDRQQHDANKADRHNRRQPNASPDFDPLQRRSQSK